jgi:uncharacterized protein with gpF-like domain
MWIKNILNALKGLSESGIKDVKKVEKYSKKIQTVDVFGSEPWLKIPAEKAIQELIIPWECSQEQIDEAKKEALKSFFVGSVIKTYAGTLSPRIFRTKRDAHHAMAKIQACASAAVDRHRAQAIGAKKFRWNYLDSNLCDFPEHKKYDKGIYTYKTGAKGDWPAKNYGCRCWSSPILEGMEPD